MSERRHHQATGAGRTYCPTTRQISYSGTVAQCRACKTLQIANQQQIHVTLMTLRRSIAQSAMATEIVNAIAPEPLKTFEPKIDSKLT